MPVVYAFLGRCTAVRKGASADRQTDGQTDRQTQSYRYAKTHLVITEILINILFLQDIYQDLLIQLLTRFRELNIRLTPKVIMTDLEAAMISVGVVIA